MCQPGRPGPHGESQAASSFGFCAFQSAKSRGSSFSSLGSWATIVVELRAGQPAVVREPRYPEVDVALGHVRQIAREQFLDERDDLGHRLGGTRLDVRPAQPEPVGVLHEPAGSPFRQVAAGHLAGGGLDVDLVVDVGDVVDERHVVAGRLSQLRSHIADHERPCVADVHAVVHRRPADVHADRARWLRQVDLAPGQRVIEPHRPSAASSRHARAPSRARWPPR